jgi:hypothetical protein
MCFYLFSRRFPGSYNSLQIAGYLVFAYKESEFRRFLGHVLKVQNRTDFDNPKRINNWSYSYFLSKTSFGSAQLQSHRNGSGERRCIAKIRISNFLTTRKRVLLLRSGGGYKGMPSIWADQ